jgi:gliding motility-associated-like protein
MKIKYLSSFIVALFMAASAFSQHQLFFENFEKGAATKEAVLNWTGSPFGNTGSNEWIIDTNYFAGGAYPKNYNEDSTYGGSISFAPYGHYLHIYDAGSGYLNDNYNPVNASDRFVFMDTAICTKNLTNVNVNFFYMCQGSDSAYGLVYYSANGSPWTQVGAPFYNKKYKWQYATITNPAFNNIEDLKIGFRWFNKAGSGKDTSSFGIDDLSVFGTYDSVNNPITCTFTTLGQDSCLGNNPYVFIQATISDTLCDAVWDMYMSNPTGSFPGTYAWYQNVGPSYFSGVTSYWYLTFPPSFNTVGHCYKYKLVRTTYPFVTFIDSVCFAYDSCPGSIQTIQPPATLDTLALCAGDQIDFPFWSTGTYSKTNEYFAQLIDSNGVKTTIDTIGHLISNVPYPFVYPYTPGDIVGTIPLNADTGCNYYIRIVCTTYNRPSTVWGPFCIRHCEQYTNNGTPIQACLASCKKQPKGFNDSITYTSAQYDSLVKYNKGNKFEVQLIMFNNYNLFTGGPQFQVINTGLFGSIIDTVGGKMLLHIPCPDTLFADGVNPGVYYIRVIADSSIPPDSSLGSIVHLTIGEPADSVWLTVVPGSGPYCQGSTITFNINPNDANPPYNSTYTWWETDKTYGTQQFQGVVTPYLGLNSSADTFEITCQENNYGCLGPKTTLPDTIVVLGKPNISMTAPTTLCKGDTGKFSVPFANNTNYKWRIPPKGAHADTSNNVLKILFDTTGTFKITVVAFNDCFTDSASRIVKVVLPPVPSITGTTTICQGVSTTLTASGGTKYTWSTGSNKSSVTVTPTADSTYIVSVSNGTCAVSDTAKVTVIPVPKLVIVPNNPTICPGAVDTLKVSGALSYIWSPNSGINHDTGSVVVVNPTSNTTYSVTGVGPGGCKDSITTNVTVDVPNAKADSFSVITQGSSVQLDASGGVTYVWNTGATTSSIVVTPDSTTTYTVTVTDANNCTASDTVTVDVLVTCKVFVPTAFSPNNDGENDVLYVRGKCITSMDFIIYDRWGNKIFESKDINDGWDGKYGGEPMNTGTYVWYLTVATADKKTQSLKGNVTLVR